MKNFFLPALGLLLFCPLFAQQTVPQGINYQAVLRDVNNQNQVLANKPTEVTFSILNGSPLGTLVYQEKHDTSSNELGQLILVIGQGMPVGAAQFADIDWSQGPKFLKIEATVDVNTTLLGTPQLQSVPYALAANPVGPAGGDLLGQYPDPNVVKIQGNPISSTPPSQPGQVLKWNGSEWVPAPDNTGDNWGTQVAQVAAPLTGNGSTTPLTILNESITGQYIQNGTIQTAEIADDAITAAKLNQMGASDSQVMKWNGSAWAPGTDDNTGPDQWGSQVVAHNATLGGNGTAATPLGIAPDGVTATEIATGAVTTTEILNNTIAAADLSSMGATANGQVLKWNGSAWAPGTDDNTGPDQWGSQVVAHNATLGGNGAAATPLGIAPDGVTATEIATGAVTTTEILNNTIAAADLSSMGATANGQVLKWNGSAWAPGTDDNTGPDQWGSQVVAHNATLGGNGAAATPLGIAPGGVTATEIATSAVTTSEILNNTIAAADLSSMGATANGQVLKWNGSAWAPGTDDNTGPDQWGSQVVAHNATLGGNGTAATPLGIAPGGVTATEIATGAVTTTEILNNTIAAADLSSMGATANGQVLKWNGSAWAPGTDDNTGPDQWGSQVVAHNATLGGNGTAASPLGIAPDGVTATEIATGAVTTTEIFNNTILATDLSSMGATANGQVLKWNGSAWAPGTDNTGGASQSNCGRLLTTGIVGLSNNSNDCPDDLYRLTIRGEDKQGLYIDATGGGNVLGARVDANNGSGSNDGIILLARANDNSSNGLKVAAASINQNNDDVAGLRIAAGNVNFSLAEDVNGTAQNYGAYIYLDDKSSNNSFSHSLRDIGLYVQNENDSDYAAYFDGDVAIPRELEFINPNNSGNGQRWALFIAKNSDSPPTNCSADFSTNDFVFEYENVKKGMIDSGTGNYCSPSDRRLKENIFDLPALLPLTLDLRPTYYNFISDADKSRTLGFIAQEVEPLFPELINRSSDEQFGELLSLNYDGFSVIAIKAIQEQQEIIEAQRARLESQEARLGALEKEMAELKALVKSATAERADKGSEK